MDTLEAIFTRRSIRRYTPQPVSDEEINSLLRAGMQAPSSGNAQPWHFIVIDDSSLLQRIPEFHNSAAFVGNAPLGILICADTTLAKPGRWALDCSAAAENMLLAAHAMGLGACWVSSEPVPERIAGFRQLSNLPENIHPVCLVTIGHPAQSIQPDDRFKSER
ncbi:MAG: nitroreductase family protein, partial [Anaerolineae bacterium]|nr:nitroreductase family protein [Anaerolineae bacterium]